MLPAKPLDSRCHSLQVGASSQLCTLFILVYSTQAAVLWADQPLVQGAAVCLEYVVPLSRKAEHNTKAQHNEKADCAGALAAAAAVAMQACVGPAIPACAAMHV